MRVSATNRVGSSEFSAVNTDGALIETAPLAPQSVRRGALTTNVNIKVEWDEITLPSETGGSPITSYQIDYDNNSRENVWVELDGFTNTFLGT